MQKCVCVHTCLECLQKEIQDVSNIGCPELGMVREGGGLGWGKTVSCVFVVKACGTVGLSKVCVYMVDLPQMDTQRLFDSRAWARTEQQRLSHLTHRFPAEL